MSRIVITGASSGIGKALAVELSRGHSELVLIARRREELEKVAAACRAAGAADVHVLPGDVSDPQTAKALTHTCEEILGEIDLLVINAGISRNKNAHRLDWEHVQAIFATNVLGALAMAVAAVPRMLQRGAGQIVGVSSIAAFRGLPTSAAYCSSKAAFTTFLESLRAELAPRGVAVSIVSPGFVKTPLTDKNKFPMPFLMSPENAARIIAKGIAKKRRHIAFPWPIVAAMRLLQILPAGIYDFLMTRKKIEI